jgi:signal transduction histidine kinase
LHAAERQRDEMLHVLSHDMRSPQAAIINLLDHSLSRAGQNAPVLASGEMVDRIRRYARRTLALADDVVQLARAEAYRYRLEPCDLRDLAINACDEVWPLAQAKGINIDSPGEGEPVWVEADPSLILRALINLLDNAIKYSPRGASVACRLDLIPAGARLVIVDTGYGIPLEQQAHLFERFRRFQAPGQPRIEGTGLGMAFVHVVIQRHGGHIAVISAPGSGTKVSVTLPRPHAGQNVFSTDL